jgi:hypothetical protein
VVVVTSVNRLVADLPHSVEHVEAPDPDIIMRRLATSEKDHDPSDGINTVPLNSAYEVTNTELTIVCQPRSPSLHYSDQF